MSAAITTELHVDGMTCNNCARKVTEAAQKISGVHSVGVSVAAQHASVRWDPTAAKDVQAVLNAIAQAGFEAKEVTGKMGTAEASQPNRWQWKLVLGLTVTAVLMAGEWVFGLTMIPWFQWLAFILAGSVQGACGMEFYRGAWRQLKAGQSNMDTLVALGSTTAFGFSCWVLFGGHGGHVYFMEAAAIISLISFGHWLEARVSERAGSALKSLLQLAPKMARKIQTPAPQGQDPASQPFNLKTLTFAKSEAQNPKPEIETDVPVSDLKTGDRVVLRPGDHVPVDGIVLGGESAVDEAMLTGESAPVDKKADSQLFTGTLNLNGRLVMRVTATGESTALAHIVAAVQRAQTSRANIQRLGDRISNVFVPVIVGLALAAGLWWSLAPASANQVHDWLAPHLWHSHLPTGAAAGFIIAAAVLIVACPCAMGLATPAAIMAAANAAARRGILIRDGVALEKAGRITTVVFDKTGTLTEGKPKVTASQFFPIELPADLKPVKIEALASSLAALSNHPLSKSIAESNSAREPLNAFREFHGRGISALVATNHLLQLGSLRWLQDEGVKVGAADGFSAEWMNK